MITIFRLKWILIKSLVFALIFRILNQQKKNGLKNLSLLPIKKNKNLFKCNHLNGYSYAKNIDLHTIFSLKEFDYLKTLPTFVFGDVIAIETFNSLKEQITFKKYIINLLQKINKT